MALGINTDTWGILYRSEGVQTTIYSQNSWTVAGYKVAYSEKFGPVTSLIGAGVGGTYIVRSYRPSPTDPTETVNEHVLGPHFLLKFEFGPTFLAFDTVLGLTHQIQQHIFLNFQDVSHVTLGLSF